MFSLLPYFTGPGFIPQARVYRLKKKKKLDIHLQQCRCKDWNGQKHIDALLVLYKCLFLFRGLGGFKVHWEVAQKICSSCWRLREREGWLIVSELSILNHEGNGEHSGKIFQKFFLFVFGSRYGYRFQGMWIKGYEEKRRQATGVEQHRKGEDVGKRDNLTCPDEVFQS